ncbi:MAG: pentapeptide repeat-containing protein [Roseofilum sp. Belize Diploria]|nr:pentapeptide repeat-containing protein [Roseofilum sp. Belize Diploria]MBP0009657.1 pentapeptide repeat-containing protein [Roseofilum sp. Belize Diploria]
MMPDPIASSSASLSPSSQGKPRHSLEQPPSTLEPSEFNPERWSSKPSPSGDWIMVVAIVVWFVGLSLHNFWMGFSGAAVAFALSLRLVWPTLTRTLKDLTAQQRSQLIGFTGLFISLAGLLNYLGLYRAISNWLNQVKWDEFGSWAEWVGAVGQIMIAILAVYISWRQYVISKDLTIQQNTITQQQTIDAFFQGISELALDDEGMLEDWPQERCFAEGRTAAILSSVNAAGKAKVIRFLSQSNLLTPLRRDYHLGRPIFDGRGGYQEDRLNGIRVINLGVMLAGVNLARTDLRWTDLSEAYLVRTDLRNADLTKANVSRTVLYQANLAGADLRGTQFFYGSAQTATPRDRQHPPNYKTGEYTGAVVENTDFSGVQELSEEQRYYCCSWCGEASRQTIPGGCEGITNFLGR